MAEQSRHILHHRSEDNLLMPSSISPVEVTVRKIYKIVELGDNLSYSKTELKMLVILATYSI